GRPGERPPLPPVPGGRIQPAPGPGRGRDRHVGQRLLPPTSHGGTLPLSPTKMGEFLGVTCRSPPPPPPRRHLSNRGTRRRGRKVTRRKSGTVGPAQNPYPCWG